MREYLRSVKYPVYQGSLFTTVTEMYLWENFKLSNTVPNEKEETTRCVTGKKRWTRRTPEERETTYVPLRTFVLNNASLDFISDSPPTQFLTRTSPGAGYRSLFRRKKDGKNTFRFGTKV